ncbi:DUF934 domain-containing protein [Glaciimonas sp. GG7]
MNNTIIKNRSIVTDDWTVLRLAEGDSADSIAIPAGKVIVPLTVWQAQRATLEGRAELGVWLSSDARPEAISDDFAHFALVAIDFPIFTDGRGYSIAFNLRSRHGYQGELRAIGDVLRDQLFYMSRVGFDAYAVRADKDINEALKGLTDFSEKYQTSWDVKTPLFRRVNRQPVTQE